MPTRRTAGSRRPRSGPPRPPQTPAELTPAAGIQLELEPEQTVRTAAYDDIDLAGSRAEGVEFRQCRFRKAALAGSHLPQIRFVDCVIEATDLSNLRAERGAFERLRVADSRMTGLALNDGVLSDVTFTGCKIDLANWRLARFDAVAFDHCNLTGADFAEADLRGAAFTDCDLAGAQFSNATMAGCRFRRCALDGVGGMSSWTGAIIHPDDLPALSHVLARALGIVVRED
ncbi:pentapeptide repeat-containing protein [Actinoplanes sp. NPDC049265]|uniref:pentapeptide repeat-containing protein n=1 Tax=Actinoplanes sp. NPDC049265 TaxID=3363902 RepID=UPI003720D085